MKYDENGFPTGGPINHVETGLAEIPEWARKPWIQGLVISYMEQINALENAAWQLWTGRFLKDCEPVVLKQWGSIVGESYREGEEIDKFRTRIAARLIVNLSCGRWSDLYRVAGVIFIGPSAMWISSGPMLIALWLVGGSRALGPDDESRLMLATKGACKSFQVFYVSSRPFLVRDVENMVNTDGVDDVATPGLGGKIFGG